MCFSLIFACDYIYIYITNIFSFLHLGSPTSKQNIYKKPRWPQNNMHLSLLCAVSWNCTLHHFSVQYMCTLYHGRCTQNDIKKLTNLSKFVFTFTVGVHPRGITVERDMRVQQALQRCGISKFWAIKGTRAQVRLLHTLVNY
jgi:hypothetical protein